MSAAGAVRTGRPSSLQFLRGVRRVIFRFDELYEDTYCMYTVGLHTDHILQRSH